MKKVLVLMLVLVLAGSASATTYDVYRSLTGSTSTNDGVGLQGVNGSLMYIGSAWGSNSGPDGMGWQKFDIPDFGAMGESIVSATLDVYVYGYNSGRPWSGVQIDRVADSSWTTSTISNSWSVPGDSLIERPPSPSSSDQGWPGLDTTDITSWFGAGKWSLTGGETVSVRYKLFELELNGQSSGIDPCRLHTGYSHMHIETIPEPATIALLGLGGLALIRRKR